MSDDLVPPPPLDSAESELDAEDVALLQEAGKSWESTPQARLQPGADVLDPDLDVMEWRGKKPGQRYVRVVRSRKQGFEKVAPGWLQATPRASAPTNDFARFSRWLRGVVLGAPLATSNKVHERLTKVKALAVLSSDALSSVAYATDQIITVLALAGVAAYGFISGITVATVCLLAIVVLSYRQTIKAYPKGGGSYIVASDNLGAFFGLVAGCALMTSYTLTVAVSVSSGADQIISAAPGVAAYKVPLCLGFLCVLALGNLRGIREAGTIFATPTYAFIGAMFLMLGTLAFHFFSGHLPGGRPVFSPPVGGFEAVGILLVLRAFASGATALTGVEAISDGVPAFKPPEWRNARMTLTAMGIILAAMFVGISLLSMHLGLVPKENDVIISQLGHTAYGNGVLYYFTQIATTCILILAGNTAFSDFPRLLYFMARDQYAPHQFQRLGDRLAFSNGIILLTIASAILIWTFDANVPKLIPLYAIGVFTAFTLSQAGMVARWLKRRESGWRWGLPLNVLGVLTTGMVFTITAVVNFLHGAWIIVVAVPVLVTLSFAIHRHYSEVIEATQAETPTSPQKVRLACLVPIADLNVLALQSLALARKMSDDVIAIHICDDEEHINQLRAKWDAWGNHVPLEIIESPYRTFVRPLLRYIDAIDTQRSDDTLIVVLPELVATRWWHHILHNQSALRLKAALLFRPGTVVVNVPYHLRQHSQERRDRRRRNAAGADSDVL